MDNGLLGKTTVFRWIDLDEYNGRRLLTEIKNGKVLPRQVRHPGLDYTTEGEERFYFTEKYRTRGMDCGRNDNQKT